jgi:hypothetical protein
MANKKELRDLFKGIADAIRTKECSTELISAKEFPERISNLSGGGGSQYRYFDISGVDDRWALSSAFSIIKNHYADDGILEITTVNMFDGADTIAGGFDGNAKLHFVYDGVEEVYGKQPMTMNHLWEESVKAGWIPSGWVEITEEEFYNVN